LIIEGRKAVLMERKSNIAKRYWPEGLLSLLLFGLLLVGPIYGLCSQTMNNVIVAVTAVVVLWYASETRKMKNEIARQNLLLTQPILTLEARDKKPVVKNEGKGPALNAEIADFCAVWNHNKKCESSKSDYTFRVKSFIAPGAETVLEMIKQNGTVSEPEVLSQTGILVSMKILYEDIVGTAYTSSVEIKSGDCYRISIGRPAQHDR
jgi:hypothetical protein